MVANFYGYDFEGGYNLFGDEFTEEPGVYLIYTEGDCLDLGEASNLKDAIETHQNTRDWLKVAGKKEILVYLYPEANREKRKEINKYLRRKLTPLCFQGSVD